ncbi:MAG TPA: hypothetical protein VIM14_12415 [Polyangia bacterium]
MSSTMSMRCLLLLFALLPLTGCQGLQEDAAPSGHLVFHGNRIESPDFIGVGGEIMLRFEDRLTYATVDKGGVSDLWISSFDGKKQRKVVGNRSDHWGEQGGNAGERYFMVDEHLVLSGGGQARAATLLRLGPTLEEEFRLDGIANYAHYTVAIGAIYDNPPAGRLCPSFPTLQTDCPQLLYERPPDPGQSLPTLMLWDGQNHLPLGADSGGFQLQPVGNNLYFILDSHNTLTRFNRPSYALDSIRDNVSRFSVSGDEHWAALAVTDDNKPKTIVLDLRTGAEIQLAQPNPSGGWGVPDQGLFGAQTFYYSQNATPSAPAELHTLDLVTGKDTFRVLPSLLANWAGTLPRNDAERLLLDSLGHGVFTGANDLIARRSLNGPLITPSFTPDGTFLVYVAPVSPTTYDPSVQGPLMFQDAVNTDLPPTMISPPGLPLTTQNGASYRFIPKDDTTGDTRDDSEKPQIFAFWAHFGRASADLYFADLDGGKSGALPTGLRLIARAIQSVSISEHEILGVMNMSQQDGVGDFIDRDLDKGVDRLFAQAVSQVAVRGGATPSTSYAAYIIRGRSDSDRSGLWLTTLAPPETPDGGTN